MPEPHKTTTKHTSSVKKIHRLHLFLYMASAIFPFALVYYMSKGKNHVVSAGHLGLLILVASLFIVFAQRVIRMSYHCVRKRKIKDRAIFIHNCIGALLSLYWIVAFGAGLGCFECDYLLPEVAEGKLPQVLFWMNPQWLY